MKLKEIDRTANTAWSPESSPAIYLAAGTAAQQLDSSFSSNATLELYFFDVNQPGLDMPLNASLPCESRFHKLIWGSHGISGSTQGDADHPSGLIVAGCDNGLMQVYDAARILKNEEEPIVLTKTKHTGAVRALDFNSFRPHIVASGASDSEIFIWDFNNPKTAMSTGTKSQPADDVTHLAWNKQVEHILASTFSTRCVMWDLRKNEPIIKVADSTSRIRYKSVAWHPTVATQMCLASEDDSSPVIQLWDLRFATSPLKVLQGHQRGVLGLAWCQQDSELLLSCGKDSNIMCWNPNYTHPGYELLCEIPTTSQWSFDVSFCPRNPLVISSCSFDGRVSIFGLSGGAQQPVTSSKLADSFPGMDMTIAQTPVPTQKPATLQLRDAPKWLKRPCGASFAFGGKLIKFENVKNVQGSGQPDQRLVTISQVVTLPDFLGRSQKLEAALASGNLGEFCEEKSIQTANENESRIWRYLRASFAHNPAHEYLDMLGFNPNEINGKLATLLGKADTTDPEVNAITDGFVSLAQGDSFSNQLQSLDSGAVFDNIRDKASTAFEEMALLNIPTDENTEGLLNQALLSGSIEFAVDLCLQEERWPEAFILASYGGVELSKQVQQKYFKKCKNTTPDMVKIVVSQDWQKLVQNCDLKYWQQALATILTHVRNEREFSALAGVLGQRLENSDDENLRKSAMICYICSGNMDKLADSWTRVTDAAKSDGANSLQDLVEQVTVLRSAAEARGHKEALNTGPLSLKMVEYATLLASQGSLESALKYLSDSTDPSMVSLRERIQYALGYQFHRPSGIAPRSRQTSESSASYHRHGSLSQKRPSYASNVNTYQPPAPTYQSAAPTYQSAVPTYQPPASVYQPTFQPAASSMSNGYTNSQTNKPAYAPPSTSNKSLPLPPVSSAASGWNDPPPLSSQTKLKSQASNPTDSKEPITHPIYGSGPVPANSSHVPTPGDYGNSGAVPFGTYNPSAPPPPTLLPPKPPLQSNPGSAYGAQNSVPAYATGGQFAPTQQPAPPGPPTSSSYKPGSVSAFTRPPIPPPAASSFSQTLFTPTPPTISQNSGPHSYGLPSTGGYASGPPSSFGYSSGPAANSAFAPSLPPSSGFTPGPPQSSGFTPGPPQSTGFAPGPPPSSGYAPGPTPSPGYTQGPPSSSGFAPGHPSSGYAQGPPSSSGFAPGPPQSSGYTPGPPPASGFTPGPPPASGFTPGPPPASGFTPGPPPSSGFTSGPPPSSGFSPGPPASTFAPGPPPSSLPSVQGSTFAPGPPPTETGFSSGPPGSGLGGLPPSAGSNTSIFSSVSNSALPPSGVFNPGPPPSSGFMPSNVFNPSFPNARGLSPKPSALTGFPPSSAPLLQPTTSQAGGSDFGSLAPPPQSSVTSFTPGLISTSLRGSRPPSAQSASSSASTSAFTSSSIINSSAYATSADNVTGAQQLPPIVPFNPDPVPTTGAMSSGWDSVTSVVPPQPSTPSPFTGQLSSLPNQSDAFSSTPSLLSPTSLNQNIASPPSLPPIGTALSGVKPAVEAEPKGPVPEDHKELVEVLEKLRSECYNVAALPQIKRKLEDVARKMEILNEKLREGSLSASTLSSLHNIIDAMKNRDYQLALSIHTQLVTAGNFAEISSFLPSVKVLIQSAAQLNVFL
ncbi:unnamed protein product [Allacma fusca]|uniref:Sec16 Sec23-binding domain-containing protein n=1 Tax=Allacma fusca TaxID=39272 RepID=A0A8J2L2S3_9HEXA|nr:unnamed protein product [Allacma fusca]